MLWRIGGALCLVQLGIPALLVGCKSSMLFHPAARPTNEEGLSRLVGVEAELLEVTRPDGRVLSGYDAKPRDSADLPVLLYFHGNASNAAYRAPWLRDAVEQTGLRIVLATYSGYGGNEGSPSEEEVYADALAFFDHLTANGVSASQIVIYGESIGGGPASHVATERACAGLILQSTFSSLSSMAWEVYPWLPLAAWLAADDFPNAERAAAASCPVLVVHGTRDGIIPFSEGRAIAAAAEAELLPIEGAGHNDLWYVGGATYALEVGHRVRTWAGD
jgi:fermentation-respiration switch protein FrsA (DUF1100 family)